jgi:hypothetical protein
MGLSEDLIAKFQKKYFETFAEKISPEDAEVELLSLAELVKITCKPVMTNKENGYEKQSITQPHS